jgi:hypothetical protein
VWTLCNQRRKFNFHFKMCINIIALKISLKIKHKLPLPYQFWKNLRILLYWCVAAYLVSFTILKTEVVYFTETTVTRLHDLEAEYSTLHRQRHENLKSPFTDFEINVKLNSERSRWLPTAVARVRSRDWSSGICGGQNGAGAAFLRVLRIPLPIFIPPKFSIIIITRGRLQ